MFRTVGFLGSALLLALWLVSLPVAGFQDPTPPPSAGGKQDPAAEPVKPSPGSEAGTGVANPVGATAGERIAETDSSAGTERVEKPMQVLTLGAGCFWCVEAVFEQIRGVTLVESGYMGGMTRDPTYQQVCSGLTGHAEVCRIEYDPSIVSVEKILEVFWTTHDPTTLNAQGPDFGTQYRSAIFYHTEEQRQTAEQFRATLNERMVFGAPVVTEIVPASVFYRAEEYHQDYFANNPKQAYCRAQILPKMKKLKKLFADFLKENEGEKAGDSSAGSTQPPSDRAEAGKAGDPAAGGGGE